MRTTLLALVLALTACTQPVDATRMLRSAGYTDIRITGYSFFACSEDDTFATGFEAKGPTGQQVKGTVCAGLLKGGTIRLD